MEDLEPSAAITALINRYNQLVDNRHTLLKQRETSNAKANAAKIEDQRKMLTPLFDALAKTLGVAPEAVHYSGENRGSGAAKCYRLTIDGRSSSVWVKVSKKKLVQVKESEVPKAKNGGKKSGGSGGNGSGNGGSGNGSGSGNPGGNKPGGSGQGGATITPKK